MPKQVTGEDGARVILEGLPYAQLPHVALYLSDRAYHVLGALARAARAKSHVEVTDQEIGQALGRKGRSEKTVQRALVELEGAALIERRRRNGRRAIVLLYTLAGREAREARGKVTSACVRFEARTRQPRRVQSPPLTGLSSKEQANKENNRDGSSPQGGEEAGDPAYLRQLLEAIRAQPLPPPPHRKRPAAGTSPKEPPRPVVRHSVPDAKDCTTGTAPSSRPDHGTRHKAHKTN